MSDRHFELPAHPNLEYYRKQAKHLQRTYATGDAAAEARVADVLGDRAAGRFLLSDAQFVLAQEHGFRTWAEFRAHVQSRSTTDDRPVSRLAGMSAGRYASMAEVLLTDPRRNAPGTLQRLRAYVPRHAAAPDTSTAELRDARLIIARELGFPTWRELVSFAEKSRRDLDERGEKRRRPRPRAEALLAGDTDRLARLTAEQADTLLHMLAYREAIPGVRFGEELGVPRAAADVLIGKATNLDLPLTWAAVFNRVEYVRLLLGAGADPSPGRGAPPRWRTPSTATAHRSSTCSPNTGLSRRRSGRMPRAAGWILCGPVSMRTAGCGRTPRRRAPTPPTQVTAFRPGSRRPTIRRRSLQRRSSMPVSTAGPRWCAGSLTSASAPTSRPTSGGPACTGRSRTVISR